MKSLNLGLIMSIEIAKILRLNHILSEANKKLDLIFNYNLPRIKSIDEIESISATASVASFIHSVYTKSEEIFKHIAKNIDRSIPDGNDWHKEIIDQMTLDTEHRGRVIRDETAKELRKIRAFRHVVRSNYVEDLESERVIENAKTCISVTKMLCDDINLFCHQQEPPPSPPQRLK